MRSKSLFGSGLAGLGMTRSAAFSRREDGDCLLYTSDAADGGDDRVGCWLDGRIDLERVYSQIWNDTAPAHVIDVAVFCDSDDTHTASISYFASSISYFAYCPA